MSDPFTPGYATRGNEAWHFDRNTMVWVRHDALTIDLLTKRLAGHITAAKQDADRITALEAAKEQVKVLAAKAVQAGERRVAELEKLDKENAHYRRAYEKSSARVEELIGLEQRVRDQRKEIIGLTDGKQQEHLTRVKYRRRITALEVKAMRVATLLGWESKNLGPEPDSDAALDWLEEFRTPRGRGER